MTLTYIIGNIYLGNRNTDGINRQAAVGGGRKKGIYKMKLYKDESISNFEFWSGARATANYLTCDELNTIESILEELYPEGLSETDLNDIFWFEDDLIAEWLGYDSFEEIMEREEK